jgi:hypothetical protein
VLLCLRVYPQFLLPSLRTKGCWTPTPSTYLLPTSCFLAEPHDMPGAQTVRGVISADAQLSNATYLLDRRRKYGPSIYNRYNSPTQVLAGRSDCSSSSSSAAGSGYRSILLFGWM